MKKKGGPDFRAAHFHVPVMARLARAIRHFHAPNIFDCAGASSAGTILPSTIRENPKEGGSHDA